jgi:predicted alpha/beta superfamily hydrolase
MKSFPLIISALAVLVVMSCNKSQNSVVSDDKEHKSDIVGTLKKYPDFLSNFVDSRKVDVWLPPDYETNNSKRYAVIYMHDGQNLFERGQSFSNEEWEVDEIMTRLIKNESIREAIIVGIWNTPKRFREYQPGKPFRNLSAKQQVIRDSLDNEYNGKPLADEYLKFIVDELKPFIDKNFRTLSDQQNTFMMGSSMGGLISIYAIAEYPDIFSAVACISTHLPISLRDNNLETSAIIVKYLSENLPNGEKNRIYFDYGTNTLDAWYEPHQQQMDSVMLELGYVQGSNWITRKFTNAEHSEISWRERLDVPLSFLIGK